jgi:hypothetical protein
MPTMTYEPIATQTLGSAVATVTFSSIPSTYNDLVLVINATASAGADIWIRCNGDSGSNYGFTALYGNGTAASADKNSNLSQGLLTDYYGTPGSTEPNTCIVQFNNYSNSTTYKTCLSRANRANSGTDAVVSMWRSTSAITSLTLRFNGAQTFSTGSTFTIYGIKAA